MKLMWFTGVVLIGIVRADINELLGYFYPVPEVPLPIPPVTYLPPITYIPPTTTTTTRKPVPETPPPYSYLPPITTKTTTTTTTTRKPVTTPPITYIPPTQPPTTYLPPVTTTTEKGGYLYPVPHERIVIPF